MRTKAEPAAAANTRPIQFKKTSVFVVNLFHAFFSGWKFHKRKLQVAPKQASERNGLDDVGLLLELCGRIVLLLDFIRAATRLFLLYFWCGPRFGFTSVGHGSRGGQLKP